MTSREFCYWLQGFFELSNNDTGLSKLQADMIKAHLSLVFTHEIDPSYPNKEKLDTLHGNTLVRC